MTESTDIQIAARFCGPSTSGNGGYTSGLLAELFASPCEVTLRSPPPLATPLSRVLTADDRAVLKHAHATIAEAVSTALTLTLPAPVSLAHAERASRAYIGFHAHPYPRCFVCGPERARGDGLGIYPGAVAGGPQLVAAPWVPTADLCDARGSVQARYTWAALDCPSWFGFASFAERVEPSLLGRLASVITRAPQRDEPCVVVGWHIGTEGRRIACASAIFGEDAQCIAYSRSTWVILKAAAPHA